MSNSASKKDAANIAHYKSGDKIFDQGDEGGDLYFIQEGEVEIFVLKDFKEVILSTMKQGEVLGVMTCLTNSPRLASARAKTEVSVKIVPHESIKKTMKEIPSWMQTVLKEFTLRINQMNDGFSKLKLENDRIKENSVNRLYISAQIANGFSLLADFCIKEVDGKKMVDTEAILSKLEAAYGYTEDELKGTLDIFINNGMLKIEVEPDSKKTYTPYAAAKNLAWFGQFIRTAKTGKNRKLLNSRLGHREQRVLMETIKHTVKSELDPSKSHNFTVKQIIEIAKANNDNDVVIPALQTASKLGLLTLTGVGEGMSVSFIPSSLSRTITSLGVIRVIRQQDEKNN